MIRRGGVWRDQQILIRGKAEVRLGVKLPADQPLYHEGLEAAPFVETDELQKGGGLQGLQADHAHGAALIRGEYARRNVRPGAVGRIQNKGQNVVPLGQGEYLGPVFRRQRRELRLIIRTYGRTQQPEENNIFTSPPPAPPR